MQRPPVSVVVPFYGSLEEGLAAVEAFSALPFESSDELLLVDNTPTQVLRGAVTERQGIRIVDASARASPYSARNVGAAAARNEWLLFTDADCRPVFELISEYFDGGTQDDWGAVAGDIVGEADQRGLIPEYIRSRRHLEAAVSMEHPYRPFVVTANVLVRREAWEAVGGFCEGVRSGADTDFCWRLAECGWRIGYRPRAVVFHSHRASVKALVRQTVRDSAGAAWLNRRYPRSMRALGPASIARCAVGVVVWTIALRPKRALFKALDAVVITSGWAGRALSNLGPDGHALPAQPGRVALIDEFPGRPAGEVPADRVEALRRPAVIGTPALPVAYTEDDGILARLAALASLMARSPVRTLRALARDGRATIDWAPAVRRIAARHDVLAADPSGVTPLLAKR